MVADIQHGREEDPRKKEEIRKETTEEVAFKLGFEEWVRFGQAEMQPGETERQSEELSTAVHFEKDFLNPYG